MKLHEAIAIAKNKLGNQYFDNIVLDFVHTEEKGFLSVNKNNNSVTITYNELCSLFRGLTLVKENANKEQYSFVATKRFAMNGYMAECSRNGVIKVSQVKELILLLALMGQNRLLLYTEDTYQMKKYPWFGYLRGGYSKEDLKEMVDYGDAFGVTLVPCIQTLGHLYRPLFWEPMTELKDGDSTLLIGEEKTYEFIEDMISLCKEIFHSKEIHIGMDESTEIGLGRYLGKHSFTNRVELFMSHLDRVIKICQKYDFEPMIWSDMFFRLNSTDQEYYRLSPLPESTLKIIPEGINLVYWDYYHDDKETYDRMISYHKDTNRDITFAGGAWRWKGFAPGIKPSFRNTIPALESCVNNGIKNVFTTGWGDNGNECSIFAVLPVIALYSCADYFASNDNSLVDSLLKAICDEPLDRFLLMDLPNELVDKPLHPSYNPSKYFLYQDPLCGIFDLQAKPEFKDRFINAKKALEKASLESINYGYIYKTLSLLCDALINKYDIGVRIRKAYKEGRKDILLDIANNEIPLLISKLNKLNAAHREQWNKENRSFGFDVVDGRMGYLKNRLETTSKVLNEFVEGQIGKISELEAEILPFNGHDYEVSWNWWLTTVTTNNL